jgi:septum formation protein
MLILASTSPRRQQLLALAGWQFVAQPANIDEQPLPDEDPRTYVCRLAEAKARMVLAGLPVSAAGETLIAAADTTVAIDSAILGKPANPAQAAEMLSRLRGRTHQVYTGLAVFSHPDGRSKLELCATDVHMREYSAAEIEAYINSGDPFDKAGAYAIQHAGFHPVDRLDGCYANVMGLPLCRLARILQQFGVAPSAPQLLICADLTGQKCNVQAEILQ